MDLFYVFELQNFLGYFDDLALNGDVANISYEPDINLFHIGYKDGHVIAGDEARAAPEIQWVMTHLDKIAHIAANLIVRQDEMLADFLEI